MARYAESFEINTHDIDFNGNLTPSNLLKYLNEAGNGQMRIRRPSYEEFFEQGLAFIVTRNTIEIYEPIKKYDKITVQTWPCPSKGVTMIRCYEIRRGDTVCARAYSAWAVPNRNTGKLAKVTEIDLSNYESEEALEMNLPVRFRLPKDLTYEKVGTRHVFNSNIDLNHHMNNSQYPSMLWDYIPDVIEKEVTSMNLRFMKEAAFDEDIEIYMAKMEEPVAEDSRAEETYCFYTLVNGEVNIEAQFGMKRIEK